MEHTVSLYTGHAGYMEHRLTMFTYMMNLVTFHNPISFVNKINGACSGVFVRFILFSRFIKCLLYTFQEVVDAGEY